MPAGVDPAVEEHLHARDVTRQGGRREGERFFPRVGLVGRHGAVGAAEEDLRGLRAGRHRDRVDVVEREPVERVGLRHGCRRRVGDLELVDLGGRGVGGGHRHLAQRILVRRSARRGDRERAAAPDLVGGGGDRHVDDQHVVEGVVRDRVTVSGEAGGVDRVPDQPRVREVVEVLAQCGLSGGAMGVANLPDQRDLTVVADGASHARADGRRVRVALDAVGSRGALGEGEPHRGRRLLLGSGEVHPREGAVAGGRTGIVGGVDRMQCRSTAARAVTSSYVEVRVGRVA